MRDETIWIVFQTVNTAAIPIAWRLTEADAHACIEALRQTATYGKALLWAIPVSNTIGEVL